MRWVSGASASASEPEVGLTLAITHDQRRTEPRTDQHVGMLAKSDRQRESAAQSRAALP